MAARIRKDIAEWGVCNLERADLAFFWVGNEAMHDLEKRMLLRNFALQYGFTPVIDYGLESAVFRNSS